MTKMPPLDKHGAARVRDIITLFLVRLGPCPLGKLFRLLYIFDLMNFRDSGRTGTGLAYFAHINGPIPTRVQQQMLIKVMVDPPRPRYRLLPKSLLMELPKGGNEFLLTVTEGAWTDEYDHMTPRMFGIMEQLVRQYKDARTTDIDVSAYDQGAWMKAFRCTPPGTIDWADTLDPHDPRTPEILEQAMHYTQRSRRLASLRAA